MLMSDELPVCYFGVDLVGGQCPFDLGSASTLNHCVMLTNSTRTVIMPTPPLNNHCSMLAGSGSSVQDKFASMAKSMFGLSDSADTPKTLSRSSR